MREIEAMHLLASLRGRGFMFFVDPLTRHLTVEPPAALDAQDRAEVKRLRAELVRLIEEGHDGNLVPLPAEIAAWLRRLIPPQREFYHHVTRLYVDAHGVALEEARRRVYSEVRASWLEQFTPRTRK